MEATAKAASASRREGERTIFMYDVRCTVVFEMKDFQGSFDEAIESDLRLGIFAHLLVFNRT